MVGVGCCSMMVDDGGLGRMCEGTWHKIDSLGLVDNDGRWTMDKGRHALGNVRRVIDDRRSMVDDR